MHKRCEGTIAIIAGASRGIGRAIAQRLVTARGRRLSGAIS
jgi:NAD(P)-dependent dehydrogenase (short-subunit alcohol dehydrogenase family)